MTLRHFSIFSEVCKQGSITKAADALNLAQPAVSSAIREMESFYGVRLFERMNRRLYITEAGEQLLHYSDSILAQYDEAKNVLREINTMTQIRIGANVSFGTVGLPELIRGFTKQHPQIPVYTQVNNSHQIEKALLNNNLDYGIIDYPEKSEYFFCDLLCRDHIVAACAHDFPISDTISAEEVSSVPLLVREEGSGSRSLVEAMKKEAGGYLNIVLESISGQSLTSACLAGMGLLILPESLLQEKLADGSLRKVHIKNVNFVREYYLVHHKSKFQTKSMKYFREYIEKEISHAAD